MLLKQVQQMENKYADMQESIKLTNIEFSTKMEKAQSYCNFLASNISVIKEQNIDYKAFIGNKQIELAEKVDSIKRKTHCLMEKQ